MKDFPHKITISLHQSRFREMLTWLHEQGHILHSSVKFGKNHHRTGDSFVTQQVCFKEANKAMMFKLAWG